MSWRWTIGSLAGLPRHDLKSQFLLPGFIDTQVNGGGGILFNDAPTVETIRKIGAAHRDFGTTGFLPTLISDDLIMAERGIAAVGTAVQVKACPACWASISRAPSSIPDARACMIPTNSAPWTSTPSRSLPRSKLPRRWSRFAPEMTTPEMIARLAKAGVIVAAGHTNASYDTIAEALASRPDRLHASVQRHVATDRTRTRRGGAALSDPRSYCGIIVDGRHVHPEVLKLALQAQAA